MAATITRADITTGRTDLTELFRASLSDGSATVLVADRRTDRDAADVRVRADQRVTVRRAANSLAHRWGWTRDAVLAHYGVEDDKRAVARGELRTAYLAEQGVRRVS